MGEHPRVVVLVPRRSDGGRRDQLWDYTGTWIRTYHPTLEVVEGDAPEGMFNRGAAINNAARKAGDWDLAIVWDGDNIVHPERLEEAITRSVTTGAMVFPGDTYMYCDPISTELMLRTGLFFPRPQIYNVRDAYTKYCLHKHISGIQVIRRDAWDKTGGFVELWGWGSEDSIFWQIVEATGTPIEYLNGSIIHFWHEHNKDETTKEIRGGNAHILYKVKRYAHSTDMLREYLTQFGYALP